MKRLIVTAALLGGFFAFGATEASAFKCARGVYRAGCVGPRGAVVRHRHYYGGVYPGGVYPEAVYPEAVYPEPVYPGGVYPGGGYGGGGYVGGGYPGGVYPGGGGGFSRNIGPNQITPGGATIPGGR